MEAVVAQWYVSALRTELSRRFGESGRSIVVECASENCRYGRIIAVESKNGEAMSIVTKYVEDQEAVDKKEAALTFDEIVVRFLNLLHAVLHFFVINRLGFVAIISNVARAGDKNKN